jgi:NACalpha-BTF3-like transcription factor
MQEAEVIWNKWYEYLDTGCLHGDNCKQRKEGNVCRGRHADLHLLTGGLLEFWTRLHDVWSCSDFIGRIYYIKKDGQNVKKRHPLEIVRVITEDGEPVVGYKAVSEGEMNFFKHQMLLNIGDEEDIVVKKKGTIQKDKLEEKKRKEQARMQNFSGMSKKQKALERKERIRAEAKEAGVSNPRYIDHLMSIADVSREKAIEALKLAAGSWNNALEALRAQKEGARLASTAPKDGSFIPSVHYDGHKPGYAYLGGEHGLGYYREEPRD